jgi:hypothetical protein
MPVFLVQKEPTSKVVIRGLSLSHRKMSAMQKGAIGGAALAGDVAIELTATQLAKLLGVSVAYIALAAKLSPSKRAAIASGRDETSFATLKQHNGHSEVKFAAVG